MTIGPTLLNWGARLTGRNPMFIRFAGTSTAPKATTVPSCCEYSDILDFVQSVGIQVDDVGAGSQGNGHSRLKNCSLSEIDGMS